MERAPPFNEWWDLSTSPHHHRVARLSPCLLLRPLNGPYRRGQFLSIDAIEHAALRAYRPTNHSRNSRPERVT